MQAVAVLVAADRPVEGSAPMAGRPVRRDEVEIAAVGKDAFETDCVLARIRMAAADSTFEVEPAARGRRGGCLEPRFAGEMNRTFPRSVRNGECTFGYRFVNAL